MTYSNSVYLLFAPKLQNLHLCTAVIASSWMLKHIGEVGANFSLQLSSRTRFAKINSKKAIAKNQCEKHKKSSLKLVDTCVKFYDPSLNRSKAIET